MNYLLYSNGMLSYLRYLLCCFVVILTYCLVLLIRSEMAGGNGRNDDAIAAALTAVAQNTLLITKPTKIQPRVINHIQA